MINEQEFWNKRYAEGGSSGAGSYGSELNVKLDLMKQLEGVNSITEFGCGDFNFGKRVMELFPRASYVGLDASNYIVEKNAVLYPFASFTTDVSTLPKADLTLCVDVLFHVLDDAECEDILKKLESYTKYLVITGYEYDNPMTSPHVKIRTLDYKRFGEPIVRQVVEDDGQKYFYIFKR